MMGAHLGKRCRLSITAITPPHQCHSRHPTGAPIWYTPRMSAADIKQAEKLARESAELARKALQKTKELEAYLGLFDYNAGRVREIKSVQNFFRSLRGA
jgi:hypothetical protein